MLNLTDREIEILDMLASGVSERETYLRLGLTESELGSTWASITDKMLEATPSDALEHECVRRYERVERQRLEAELWASEARLNALMDIAPEAILVANGRSGRILKVNHQAAAMFGYSARELVGTSVEILISAEMKELHIAYRKGFLQSIRKREMGYHPPISAIRKDGSTIEMDIALTASAATDDVMVVCRERTAESNLNDGHQFRSAAKN
jgi:PAS domain S-box-containing protein